MLSLQNNSAGLQNNEGRREEGKKFGKSHLIDLSYIQFYNLP